MIPKFLPRAGFFFFFLSLLLSKAFAAPWTSENAAWNINFNSDGSDPSKYYGKWEGHEYHPSPTDWRSIPIYQIITDRFFDGDPRNNQGRFGGYSVLDLRKRQGGDFKGITAKLDYIKLLGFRAIWISPIFQNTENGYHGYGQIDFTLLDERFGTLEEFRDMVSEAHKRGVYVLVDIVVNHMGNLLFEKGFRNKAAPFRLHDDEYQLSYYNDSLTYQDFVVDNTFHKEGSYCDIYDFEGKRLKDSGTGSFWQSDFHHNGTLNNWDDPWKMVFGNIYGVFDDLRTSHPRVQDKIIAMTKALISSTDIDGIRLDTPMQVPRYFLRRWGPAVRGHARRLGKENFFVVGETYAKPSFMGMMLGRGKGRSASEDGYLDGDFGLDSGINYPLYLKFLYPVFHMNKKGDLDYALKDFKDAKNNYDLVHPILKKWRYRLLNFFDSHDQRRLARTDNGVEKIRLATAFIAFWPGIPLFYYGDEQSFSSYGTGLEGHARESMMASLAWQDHPSAETSNRVGNDNFDMTSPAYLDVQRIMEIRSQYDVFSNSDLVDISYNKATQDSRVFAFLRSDSKGEAFSALVIMNLSGKSEVLNSRVKFNLPNVTLVNALDPRELVRVSHSGFIKSIDLAPYDLKVLVVDSDLQESRLRVRSVTPEHFAYTDLPLQDVVLTFTKGIECASLRDSIIFNDAFVAAENLTCDSERGVLKFSAAAKEGINIIEIAKEIKAVEGKGGGASFRSIFRFGSSDNVIANRDFDYDSMLVNGSQKETWKNRVSIINRANGAKYFRVSNNGGRTWTDWRGYSDRFFLHLRNSNGWQNIVIQYWTEGSGAYFVRGGIDKIRKDSGIRQ